MVSRRTFLVGLAAGGAGLSVDAFGIEPRRVQLTRHDVPVPGLLPALDGVTVAQISDTHLPGNVAAAEAALAIIARERPEIVLLTGDIIDRHYALSTLHDFASQARGTVATYAILGNHEYAYNIARAEAEREYGRAGVQLLVNGVGRADVRGGSVEVVGFDDYIMGAPDESLMQVERAAADLRFWMVHEPGFAWRVPAAAPSAPTMILAGHTHGGQVRIPGMPPVLPQRAGGFVEGWYRTPPVPLYVSRGVGTSGIPARLLCPPEVPLFTFRRA